MPLKLKPNSVIKADLGIQPGGRVQRFFQDECYKAMDRFVPRSLGSEGGNLRETVDLSDPNYIIYEMPYAKYQYYGIRQDGTHIVMNYTTHGTGRYWDKRMWSVKSGEIIKKVQHLIDSGGN